MKSGIHYNINFDDYKALPYFNASKAKLWARSRCPAEFRHKELNPEEDKASFVVGRIVDGYLTNNVPKLAVYGGAVRRGKEWDAFQAQAQAAGNEIITQNEYDQIMGMVRAVQQYSNINAILSKCKKAVLVGELCQTMCKAEVDCFYEKSDTLFDIKTCQDASPDGFSKAAYQYGYHIQAAFYLDLCESLGNKKEHFQFICIEKEAPWLVNLLTISKGSREYDLGRQQYTTAINSIALCEKSGEWAGYNHGEPVLFTDWQLKPLE